MMLNGKQKSYLRSLANGERAVFQIGKEGVSDNLIIGVSDYLEAHELVKISVLPNCDYAIREVAFDLAAATQSDIIQLIGRTIVLYRQSKEKKIRLPKK